MRTLKLDWSAERIKAVLNALDGLSLTPSQVAVVRDDLGFYREMSATLKLDWPAELINALVRALDTVESDEVRAAAQEIREYRETVDAIRADDRQKNLRVVPEAL